MKKLFVIIGIIIMTLGLCGCSLGEPALRCSSNKVMEDISTLPDKDCKTKYNNKDIEVSGMVLGVNYTQDGILYYSFGTKWGAHHNWYVAAYFSDKDHAKEAKKFKNGLWVTVRGTGQFIIHENGERGMRILNAKLVE